MIRRFMTAALALVAAPAVAQEGIGDGQLAFNNHCRTCHTVEPGDNRLGPTLHGIIGREAGTVAGYTFSQALATSEIIWNPETLDAFIENPDDTIRGNAMQPYGGIAEPEVREAIIGYLSQQ